MSESLSFIGIYLQDPASLMVVAGVLGLVIGSFLNVVIHRVPLMLKQEWREQCAELYPEQISVPDSLPLNLVKPGSHCPHCGHSIRAWENIPVLSYLWQRGRCRQCGEKISLRYPLVEIASAGLAVVLAWKFGLSWALGGALLLTWVLLALSVIDLDHQWLPDNMTLPFLWLGLLFNVFGVYTDLASAVIGAMAGYLLLWTVYWGFRLFTGKEGMGFGDFKLFAMLGAWLGWQVLPAILLFSSLVGAIIGISLILIRGHDRNIPIPFGPYLAVAGWAGLMWQTEIIGYYTWAGPPV